MTIAEKMQRRWGGDLRDEKGILATACEVLVVFTWLCLSFFFFILLALGSRHGLLPRSRQAIHASGLDDGRFQ